jgi:flavin reductase (DIM6/NTAB) family NADH-FMN oxidoreductase RutF
MPLDVNCEAALISSILFAETEVVLVVGANDVINPAAKHNKASPSREEFNQMQSDHAEQLIPLACDQPLWDRFFGVFPLVIVGSKEEDGTYNLAPKHMAMPLGWESYYCFVCSPNHSTYHNIRRHKVFTVSYPRPTEVLLASLAAAPRCEDLSKPTLLVLPTFPAFHVEGSLVRGCYLYLECALHSILDGFGPNSLIIGNVVAATAHDDALRREEQDESDQIFRFPLLAYVSPGRLAEIRQTMAFPFPKGFSR